MNDLILVAASGLAREVLSVVELTGSHRVVGFVDDNPGLSEATIEGLPVLGPLEAVKNFAAAELLVCAGAGTVRKGLVQRLTALGVSPVRFSTIIHPGVDVPTSCTIGHGSILLANVVLTAKVSIGEHVVAMPNVTFTHDDTIGDFATLCAGVSLGGNIDVGEAAYIGMNASIREGVRVGVDAVLGMGATLLEDLPAREVWAGIPARRLTHRLTAIPPLEESS